MPRSKLPSILFPGLCLTISWAAYGSPTVRPAREALMEGHSRLPASVAKPVADYLNSDNNPNFAAALDQAIANIDSSVPLSAPSSVEPPNSLEPFFKKIENPDDEGLSLLEAHVQMQFVTRHLAPILDVPGTEAFRESKDDITRAASKLYGGRAMSLILSGVSLWPSSEIAS